MRWLNRLPVILVAALLLCSCAASKYAVNADYPVIKSKYVPKGTLTDVFFPSSEPGITQRRAYVYLPDGYDLSDCRYPVLYLLHGARGNETVWIDKAEILKDIDSLVLCGAMKPTIVVFPNMNQYNSDSDYGKSRLKSALESFYEVDGTVEKRFIHDVVNATDSMFRTIPVKDSRAVAGLSIGAMQSIYLSANFPDSFGYVGMFSPMVYSFLKPGRDNGFYFRLAHKLETQFADAPSLYLLRIGHRDFFCHTVKGYSRYLDSHGYPYDVKYVSGGHEWYNWRDFCDEFMSMLWK